MKAKFKKALIAFVYAMFVAVLLLAFAGQVLAIVIIIALTMT